MDDEDDEANVPNHPADNELGHDAPDEPTCELESCLKINGTKKLPTPQTTFKNPLTDNFGTSPPRHQPHMTETFKKAI